MSHKEELSAQLFRVRLDLNPGETIQFIPGQFMSIAVAGFIRRSYSFANPPKENTWLETFVDTTPGGPGSIFFDQLQLGQEVDILAPLGHFVYEEGLNEVHFFATGTGVTPFISMIRHELETVKSGRKLFLHYGVRERRELIMHEDLARWSDSHLNFTYHPFLSRESTDWGGKSGRITQHISEVKQGDSDIYICGGKEMIIDVEKGLLAQGHNLEHIFYERFY